MEASVTLILSAVVIGTTGGAGETGVATNGLPPPASGRASGACARAGTVTGGAGGAE
jgi:hypothetical protein